MLGSRGALSRRTTGIITAVVLILLGAAAGYGISNVVSSRAPEEGLSEAQVGSIATRLVAARNELLITPPPEEREQEQDEDATPEPATPTAAADLLEGRASGGVTLSQGAIVAERQTYRQLRERRGLLANRGTTYEEADVDIEVESLTINESTAIAIVSERSRFSGEQTGKTAEIEQTVERVMSLSREGGSWTMRSMRTMSGKDAPENGS